MTFRKCLGWGGETWGNSLDVSNQLRPQKEEKPRQINLGCWMQKAFVGRSKMLPWSQERLCCWPRDKMLYLSVGASGQDLAAAESPRSQRLS